MYGTPIVKFLLSKIALILGSKDILVLRYKNMAWVDLKDLFSKREARRRLPRDCLLSLSGWVSPLT